MQATQHHHAQIIRDIQAQGYSIVDAFLDEVSIQRLANYATSLKAQGLMHQASTGTNKTLSAIRGDFIEWIEASNAGAEEHLYLATMDALQQALNQAFYLGLFELESHFAIYPAGASYHKHLDQFVGNESRQITCILYLNQDWHVQDGGQLRIYLDKQNQAHFLDITPSGGKLVVFVSGDFIHEVLPATRERLAITGWFRTRSEKI